MPLVAIAEMINLLSTTPTSLTLVDYYLSVFQGSWRCVTLVNYSQPDFDSVEWKLAPC